MRALEYRGELGFATAGYRGFAITKATIRNAQGKLVSINCVAFFTDFGIKDEVKAFCKERGGNWNPAAKFWFAPVDKIAEALEIINEFRSEVDDSLYMVCSGYGSEKVAASIEKAIAKSRLSVVESAPQSTEPQVENVQWVSEADEVEGTGKEGHYEGEMHFDCSQFPQLVMLHKALPFDAPARIKEGFGNEYREVLDTQGNKWYAEPIEYDAPSQRNLSKPDHKGTIASIGLWADLEYSESLDKFIKKA